MDTIPEPAHYGHNKRKENRFQGKPHFGEATILINDGQMQVSNISNVQIHLALGINGQTYIHQIIIVM